MPLAFKAIKRGLEQFAISELRQERPLFDQSNVVRYVCFWSRLPTAAAGGCGLAALVGRMLVNAAHTHDSTQGSGRLVIRAA